MRAFSIRSLALIVAVFGSAACSVYDPALLATDAGVTRDLGRPRDLGTTCTTCPAGRPPARPASPDGDGPEAFYALRNIQIVQDGNRWKTIGYDLMTSVDVRSTPGSGGPGVSCDALSVGLAFDGTRATWAGIADGFTLENRCP